MDSLIKLKRVKKNDFEGIKYLEVLKMEKCIKMLEFEEKDFGGNKYVDVKLKRI